MNAIPYAESSHPARVNSRAAQSVRLGECTIDRIGGRIVRPGGAARIEPRVMDVLLALVARAGRTVSRDELIEAVWGHPNVSDEALSRCVSLARKALGDNHDKPRFVETVPKRGYRLLQPTESAGAATLRIAVLPFVNLSGRADFQHFADGLTELVIAHASTIPWLRVVSRTSSMRYRDARMLLPDIARELGVSHVTEGSVFVSSGTVQAVLQLIEAATDTHVLTRTYQRELADPIQTQNEIASSMADALRSALAA
ncbi:MAG: winged helix-turn-helix domain-containing protein [Burkholderiales bacterium]|nr:winged helix-turn-helix domain-containing protein [Burkholderiales bacterium]